MLIVEITRSAVNPACDYHAIADLESTSLLRDCVRVLRYPLCFVHQLIFHSKLLRRLDRAGLVQGMSHHACSKGCQALAEARVFWESIEGAVDVVSNTELGLLEPIFVFTFFLREMTKT